MPRRAQILVGTVGILGAINLGCGGNGGSSVGQDGAGGTNGGTGGGTSGSGELVCVAGTIQPCEGPNGCSGTRTCNDDGTGYAACQCGSGAGGGQQVEGTGGSGGVLTDGTGGEPDGGTGGTWSGGTGGDQTGSTGGGQAVGTGGAAPGGVGGTQSTSPCSPDPCNGHGLCQAISATEAVCGCMLGWSGEWCDIPPPPFFYLIEVDCSGGPNPGHCMAGGVAYPVLFEAEHATSCSAVSEVTAGTGSPGTVSEVTMTDSGGEFQYTTGSVVGDTVRISVTCTGVSGEDTSYTQIVLE